MTAEEFLGLVGRFAGRPMPAVHGRHVYLWHGDMDRLVNAAPADVCRALDLHSLAATLLKAPRALDEARQLLRRAIQQQLDAWRHAPHQQVIVVTGCDLLCRYQVALAPFFAAASECVMVVMVVSSAETAFQPAEPLPEYVALNPRAALDYLRAALDQPEAVINPDQEAS